MRIIAGDLRSRVLQTPPGTATRPTSDRLRETLFNVLGPRLPGARFLDLYAGSGANALEALSRGAQSAVLVEQAPPALAAIRANLAALALTPQARVHPVPVRRWLREATPESDPPFDILFLDPPYDEANEYTATLEALGGPQAWLIAPGGLVIAEHRRLRAAPSPHPNSRSQSRSSPQPKPQTGIRPKERLAFQPADRYGHLQQTRRIEQGDAALCFFQLVPPSDTLPPTDVA